MAKDLKHKPMHEAEVIEYLEGLGVQVRFGDVNEEAKALLLSRVPDAEKRFHKALDILEKLIRDVEKYFPDCELYSECDTPTLLIGSSHSHDRDSTPQQGLITISRSMPRWDGGAW